MPKEDILAQRALQNAGQGNYSANMSSSRGIYPAIVVPYGTNDNSEQNRIRVRIVNVQEDGKIQGKSNSGNEENYNNYAGKDRGILDENLVLCMPLLPEFFHVRPQVGEMVFVIVENPGDASSVRYWIGPIISSKLKLSFQGYEDAFKIFNKTSFISNQKTSGDLNLSTLLPGDADVAIQGRNDADLILKNREVFLIAGKFSDQKNFQVNTEYPSYLRLKQINNATATESEKGTVVIVKHKINVEIAQDNSNKFVGTIIVKDAVTSLELINDSNSYLVRSDIINWLNDQIDSAKEKYPNWEFSSSAPEFKNYLTRFDKTSTPDTGSALLTTTSNQEILQKYSEAIMVSTNINIYSPRGKFRGDDIKSFEKNQDLKSFGQFSDTLHPAIFGDETLRVLDLIIKLLLNHIHTPEMPLVQTSLSDELKKYTVDGLLQNLISNHVRIN